MTAPAPALVHVWARCHGCGARPIAGRQFECRTCPAGPDNALCEACYASFQRGLLRHPHPDNYADLAPTVRHTFEAHEGQPLDAYLPWLTLPIPRAAPPAVPDGFLVRPEFRCGLESFFAGYGFAARPDSASPPLLLTGLHVMDEFARAKGVDCSPGNAAYSGLELPCLVTKVTLYDIFAPNWMTAELGVAGPMLILPGARIGDEEPYSQRDIAAFRAESASRLSPLILAAEPPQPGHPVWLAVRPDGRRTGRTFAAVVVEQSEQTLIYRFAGSDRMPKYSSGAPLLNSRGEVAGINVGAGCLNGCLLGHANHAASIRRHLHSATVAS